MSKNVKEITKNRTKCTNFVKEIARNSNFFLTYLTQLNYINPITLVFDSKTNPEQSRRVKKIPKIPRFSKFWDVKKVGAGLCYGFRKGFEVHIFEVGNEFSGVDHKGWLIYLLLSHRLR